MLDAACAWEDWVYNLTRPVKTLRLKVNDGRRRWQPRSPAVAAGLTDHIATAKELLMTVAAPDVINTKQGGYRLFCLTKTPPGECAIHYSTPIGEAHLFDNPTPR